ncbi:MAG: hypothetical protein AB7U81_11185 [Thiohalomonadaceae bacterium]
MPTPMMFFCKPQKAYMLTDACRTLRARPVGRTPGGVNARPPTCEDCTLSRRVDARDVPTVSLDAYLAGTLPASDME